MDLVDNLNFYIEHQDNLVKKYDGQFIVLYNGKFVKNFKDLDSALSFGVPKYGKGNFSIQEVSPGPESYTATFHSRVSFGWQCQLI